MHEHQVVFDGCILSMGLCDSCEIYITDATIQVAVMIHSVGDVHSVNACRVQDSLTLSDKHEMSESTLNIMLFLFYWQFQALWASETRL